MDNSNNYAAKEAVLYAAIMALVIGKDMSANELNIVGNFFQAIGQNLEVLSAISGGGLNNSGSNSSILEAENNNLTGTTTS